MKAPPDRNHDVTIISQRSIHIRNLYFRIDRRVGKKLELAECNSWDYSNRTRVPPQTQIGCRVGEDPAVILLPRFWR
jgi:hypothetical protein